MLDRWIGPVVSRQMLVSACFPAVRKDTGKIIEGSLQDNEG